MTETNLSGHELIAALISFVIMRVHRSKDFFLKPYISILQIVMIPHGRHKMSPRISQQMVLFLQPISTACNEFSPPFVEGLFQTC